MSIQTHYQAAARLNRHADRDSRTDDILRRASAAVEPQRSELLHQVVTLNLALAEALAQRYRGRGIEDEDLRQVAYLGLTNAALRFTPQKGTHFVSFAVPTITGELKRHFRDHGWAVRPPRRLQELRAEVSTASDELTQRLARTPDTTDLATSLNVDKDDVRRACAFDAAFHPVSLDHQLDDATPLAESIGAPDDAFSRVDARAAIADACRRLPARDRRILYLRYFHGATQQEIAVDIGVTQMQVSRLLTAIIRNLRIETGIGDIRPSQAPVAAPNTSCTE